MSTWEERMSQRAGGMNSQERVRKGLLWADPAADEEYAQRKRDQGFVLVGGKWFKAEPEEGPDYCRECCSWDTQEGIYKMTCFETYMGMHCRYGHDHHEGEVWLA